MTIQVVSNGISNAKVEDKSPEAAKPNESPNPAPEASEKKDASEQKKPSTESDTEEPEAKEESKDESEEEVSDEEPESKESEKDEKPKKKGGFQRRIDKLNARNAEKDRELERLRTQLASKDAGTEKKAADPKAAEGEPSPDSFETHTEYVKAVAKWTLEQDKKAESDKKAKSDRESEQEKIVKTYTERFKSFAEKTEDLTDVLESVDDIQISPAVRDIILTSENGPQLAYELAKNREEYERICSLSPLAAARELGRFESKLSPKAPETKPEPNKITKAPKPIEPIGKGKAAITKSIDDPTLSQSEYERLRREQKKRKEA